MSNALVSTQRQQYDGSVGYGPSIDNEGWTTACCDREFEVNFNRSVGGLSLNDIQLSDIESVVCYGCHCTPPGFIRKKEPEKISPEYTIE